MGVGLDGGFTIQSDADWPSVPEMSVPEIIKGLSFGLFNGVLPSIGVLLRTAHYAFGSLSR